MEILYMNKIKKNQYFILKLLIFVFLLFDIAYSFYQYFGEPIDGDVPNIAQRHRDKSFLTIHIGSDRGGLWLADNRDTILADAGETQTDSVLIFLSRKAWEITRGTLKGIIHGVRDTTFPSLLGRMPRHTAVGFFHAEVSGDERAWAAEHMHELSIPEHVKRFELS